MKLLKTSVALSALFVLSCLCSFGRVVGQRNLPAGKRTGPRRRSRVKGVRRQSLRDVQDSIPRELFFLSKGSKKGDGPLDLIRDFFEAIVKLITDGKVSKGKGKGGSKGGINLEGLIEFLLDLKEANSLLVSEPLDTSLITSKQADGFLQYLIEILSVIIKEYLSDPGTLLRYGLVQSPFPVHKFPDGTPPTDSVPGEGLRQYGWAADFNKQCGIGAVIHSAGTTAAIFGSAPSKPTLTLRDGDGTILFKGLVGFDTIGIRSAIVFDCDNDVVRVIAVDNGSLGPGVPPTVRFGRLMELSVDLMQTNPTVAVTELKNNIEAPTARSMKKVGDCHVIFAPSEDFNYLKVYIAQQLNDQQSLTFLDAALPDPNPRILSYDVCNGGAFTTFDLILNGIPNALENNILWEFNCADDMLQKCWFSLSQAVFPNSARLGNFDYEPKLFYGSLNQILVDRDMDADIVVTPVTTGITSAKASFITNSPIGVGDKALVCGMSGFVYQLVGGAFIYGNIEAALLSVLESGFDSDLLEPLEIGDAQECQICSSTTGGCVDVELPGLVDSNVYGWETVECGDYCFVGTLDLGYTIGGLFVDAATGPLAGIFEDIKIQGLPPTPIDVGNLLEVLGDFLDVAAMSNSEILRLIEELTRSTAMSLLLGDFITPYDHGFDLWYIKCADLENSGPLEFTPVTVNGFRGLDYKISESKGKGKGGKGGSKGSSKGCDDEIENDWKFSFLEPVEEGVRTMVCHTDEYGENHKLVVGSVVYGDNLLGSGSAYGDNQESSTYVLDVGSCEEED